MVDAFMSQPLSTYEDLKSSSSDYIYGSDGDATEPGSSQENDPVLANRSNINENQIPNQSDAEQQNQEIIEDDDLQGTDED